MTAPLRVCIDARLRDGEHGGVQQVVLGLAHGLGSLTDGDEIYLFLTHDGEDAWLRPHMGANAHALSAGPVGTRAAGWKESLALSRAGSRARALLRPLLDRRPLPPVPHSDGRVEAAGADIMHFTMQSAFLTRVPSIFHPHDLQHIHMPEFFSKRQRDVRDAHYRRFCTDAAMIAAATSWVKDDLVSQLHVSPDRVRVVELAPPNQAYPEPAAEDIARVRARYDLPAEFVLYPAQTWPHKNHIGLLRAIARLRDEHGLVVPLVSSGGLNEFYPRIRAEIARLRLGEQVRFVGFVQPDELQALYRMCRAVVIPTKFEAASYPVWEAFLAGTPVAASTVTSLPKQVGDAGLLFDPDDTAAMAEAVRRLWTDSALRVELAKRGSERVRQFTWERTARMFRAHYRRLAGRPLSHDDRALIDAQPLL